MKRVTACHGVGREPGDGRGLLHSSYLFVLTRFLSHAFLSPVPRVLMTFYTKTSGFAADAAAPLAIVMSPVSRAFKFRSLTRASSPTNFNLAQHSLGHMWVNGDLQGCWRAIASGIFNAIRSLEAVAGHKGGVNLYWLPEICHFCV